MSIAVGIDSGRKNTILIVDDIPSNLELMDAVFSKAGFAVCSASDGITARDIFSSQHIDLAVVDVMMPGMNGFELCKTIKSNSRRFFPVILLTALNDSKSRIKGLESGADDFISKPFVTSELITKIQSLLRLKDMHDELDHSEDIIMSLVAAMEARDAYTNGHSARVGDLSSKFASYLGCSSKEQKALTKAGKLHDIGKIGISECILNKPGNLTLEETDIIRMHTVIGEDICKPLTSLKGIIPGIRSHHERWDGKGFPHGLCEEEIPLMARILSIADSFDAMVSERPYRSQRSVINALQVLESERDSGQWDPELTASFISMMNNYSEGEQHRHV